MHKLGGELCLADTAQPGRRCNLPDRGELARLYDVGKRQQVIVPPNKQRIARHPHP